MRFLLSKELLQRNVYIQKGTLHPRQRKVQGGKSSYCDNNNIYNLLDLSEILLVNLCVKSQESSRELAPIILILTQILDLNTQLVIYGE